MKKDNFKENKRSGGMDKYGIGDRVKEVREAKDLTQLQLAEMMEVSEQTIGNIERGAKGTRLSNFIKLFEILEVSADYILFGKK
jgi:transcriptional regulator with XRE-family HTH domain